MNTNRKGFAPLAFIFLFTTTLLLAGNKRLVNWGADVDVLIIGNILIFVLTAISYFMAVRGVKHSNPNVFFRAVYGSIMMKMFACIIGAFIYISMARPNINKPALFICMGLYLLYTFTEVAILMKMLRTPKNG
jgi:hypothetical protein